LRNNAAALALTTSGPLGQGGDTAGSLQALQVLSGAGLSTFVAGISLDAEAQPVLNQMAMAGGQPRAGGLPYFYPVLSTDDLVAAIRQIAGQITSCTFPLTTTPPDPSMATITESRPSCHAIHLTATGGISAPLAKFSSHESQRNRSET
jgi:hypothetical protein